MQQQSYICSTTCELTYHFHLFIFTLGSIKQITIFDFRHFIAYKTSLEAFLCVFLLFSKCIPVTLLAIKVSCQLIISLIYPSRKIYLTHTFNFHFTYQRTEPRQYVTIRACATYKT